MSEALSRARLPLLLVSLLFLVGGSKLDSVRPLEGQIVAFVIPAVAVGAGVVQFLDAPPRLRNAVFAVGALVLAVAVWGAYRVVFDDAVASPALTTKLLVAGALAFALWCEVAAAQRGLRARLCAWLGLAAAFGLYFPGHAAPQNLFGSVFAAFFVALFLGGGFGLFAGELAVRRVRR